MNMYTPIQIILHIIVTATICAFISQSSWSQSTVGPIVEHPLDEISLQRIKNAYGLRLGTGFRDGSSEAKVVFNPYFEIPLGDVFFSAELQINFLNFKALNLFQSTALPLDAYGWAGKFRWYYGNSPDRFFSSVGLGMTIHQVLASVELPLSTGYLWALSKETEGESLISFIPLDYLGQRLGWFFSFTLGLRFPNY